MRIEELTKALRKWLRWAEIIPPSPEEVEQEIAKLVAQVPEWADLFEKAREVNRDSPEQLWDIVKFGRWLLDEEERRTANPQA